MQQFRQGRQPAAGRDVRRGLEHEIAQHVGDVLEPLRISCQPRGIPRREFRDLLFGLAGAHFQILVRIQRQKVRESALDDAQSVPRQVEIADDLRVEQGYRVSRDRIAKARIKLLGHRCAADHVPALEHRDRKPRRREVVRAHEPVVAAADDHGIALLKVSHGLAPASGFALPVRRRAGVCRRRVP